MMNWRLPTKRVSPVDGAVFLYGLQLEAVKASGIQTGTLQIL